VKVKTNFNGYNDKTLCQNVGHTFLRAGRLMEYVRVYTKNRWGRSVENRTLGVADFADEQIVLR